MNNIDYIQKNPLRAVLTLSLPIIALLILQTSYSVIDIYWISSLGQSAVIAVSFVLNVWYGVQKLGEGIGRSCSVIISASYGAQDNSHASNVALHGLIMVLVLSVIFPLIFLLFFDSICALGHLEQYSDLIFSYFLIPSVFSIVIFLSNFFNSVLNSEGDTKRAAMIVIVGNIVNIILDPIMIYTFNLGLLGAGLATMIGFTVSMFLFYYLFYVRADVVVRLDRNHFSYDINIFRQIIETAVPLILNGFILMILGLLINYALNIFSNPQILFGFVILLRIQTLLFTPIQGVCQGICIVTAHLSGAGRFKAIKSTVKKATLTTVVFSMCLGLIYAVFYKFFVSFYSTDTAVMRAVASILVFPVIMFFLHPCVRICGYVFIGLKKSFYSLFSLLLNVALFAGFMYVGAAIFHGGAFAIFLSVSLADLVQLLVMAFLLQRDLHILIIGEDAGQSVQTD